MLVAGVDPQRCAPGAGRICLEPWPEDRRVGQEGHPKRGTLDQHWSARLDDVAAGATDRYALVPQAVDGVEEGLWTSIEMVVIRKAQDIEAGIPDCLEITRVRPHHPDDVGGLDTAS